MYMSWFDGELHTVDLSKSAHAVHTYVRTQVCASLAGWELGMCRLNF